MKKQIKALLVEDNKQQASLIRDALSKVNHCTVSTVDSVQKAFGLLSKNRFDVILSDYTLPDRNGIEFLRELKKKDFRLIHRYITYTS